jgi:hypothetical protein
MVSTRRHWRLQYLSLAEEGESRYYLDKEQVPVLEVEVHQPGSLITEYRWIL